LGERENGVQERKKGGDTSKGEQKIKDNILTATKKKRQKCLPAGIFQAKKKGTQRTYLQDNNKHICNIAAVVNQYSFFPPQIQITHLFSLLLDVSVFPPNR
jgi:hypothetical protein